MDQYKRKGEVTGNEKLFEIIQQKKKSALNQSVYYVLITAEPGPKYRFLITDVMS